MIRLIFLLVLMVTGPWVNASLPQQTVSLSPPQAWIKTLPFSTVVPNASGAVGGIVYVLLDRQVKIQGRSETVWHSRNVDYIATQAGLTSASQLNMEFDPSYQKLTLNSLVIHRQGRRIDKLKNAKINIIQREKELENQIYDGRLTANINLDDVQVGDFVESAFTLEGDNPVFAGTAANTVYLQWSTPVEELAFRLVWHKPNAPQAIKIYHSDIPLQHLIIPEGHEYLYRQTKVPARTLNAQAPTWFRPYSRLEVSDFANWQQVVQWALTLYAPHNTPGPEIHAIAAEIRGRAATVDAQIVAALQLVQGQVRYLGIELGINSHKPSAPLETWTRKFGDCKDKSTLLVAILRELGVEAYPALVNTELKQYVGDRLPSPKAFNHVITKVTHNGKFYWLDPTRTQQFGPLDSLHQTSFGSALVIAPETTALESVAPPLVTHTQLLSQYFLQSDTDLPIELKVTSEFLGYHADKIRYEIANRSQNELAEAYLNFYKNYFTGISSQQPAKFIDDKDSGKITLTEYYDVENFWEKNPDGRPSTSFYADLLLSELKLPDERARNSPFTLNHPNRASQSIKVYLYAGHWDFSPQEDVEDNDYFYFKRSVKYSQATLTLDLNYTYFSKTDAVPADKIDAYTAAVKRAEDFSEYSIYGYTEEAQPADNEMDYFSTLMLAWFGLAVFSCGFTYWLRTRDENTNAAALKLAFYPVDHWRFNLLNLTTLGLYCLYFIFMNWRYIARKDQKVIHALVRAVFSPIWIFALFTRITSGPEQHKIQLPRLKVIGLVYSGLFAASYALSFVEALGIYQIINTIIGLLLGSALAWLVLNIQQADPTAAGELTKWKLRHYLLATIYLPMSLYTLGSADRIFPGQEILENNRQSKIGTYYLRSNGVFSDGENPLLFYSQDSGEIFSAGFGATNSSVYKYWREDGELQFTKLRYEKIRDIKMAPKEDAQGLQTIIAIDINNNELTMPVTTYNNKHKAFFRKIVALWKSHQPLILQDSYPNQSH